MENTHTPLILKSTCVRNMFCVFPDLEFPFIFVWESDSTCMLQGQKAEHSNTFLSCSRESLKITAGIAFGEDLIKGSKVVSIR